MSAVRQKLEYDMDGDGKVTDEELARRKAILDLELREEKAETQKKMAIFALIMIAAIVIVLTGSWIPLDRIEAISPILSTSIYALAGVVGAFMGFTAWMSKGDS